MVLIPNEQRILSLSADGNAQGRSKILIIDGGVKNAIITNYFIAFILYRQHHQQAIIARNPGLNNPDISKIIGEQWKAEGEESKKVWQDLAQVGGVLQSSLIPSDIVYRKRKSDIKNSTPTTAISLVELVGRVLHSSTLWFSIQPLTNTAVLGVVDAVSRRLLALIQIQWERQPCHFQTTRRVEHPRRAICP